MVTQEFEVKNPITGEKLATLPIYTPDMVAAAAARARAAQPAWAATPAKERAKIVRRFGDMLYERQEHFIDLIRRENGKARGGAMGEILVTANFAEYYARHAAAWLKPEKRKPFAPLLYSAQVHHKPHGVVGNISPWNFPLVLAYIDMLPALLAGNAVILKPSEVTPLTAIEAAKLLHEAGVPADAWQVITGMGETGAALIEHIDMLMFTGSPAIGKKVAVQAAQRLIPFSLELGSIDPMLVLQDADLEKAAASAVSAGFENTGQLCMKVQRVFVDQRVYEDFLAAVKRWAGRLVVGKSADFATHIGSMTTEREVQRTEKHIQDALQKGGRLVSGGKRLPELGPLFMEPTVIADADPSMVAMQTETFGPLITITPFSSEAEAVQMVNAVPYGLSGSIWSRNTAHAKQLALQLETGDVCINAALIGFATQDAEFGGQKHSGYGRRNSKQGLLKFTYPQSIITDRLPQTPDAPTVYTAKILKLAALNRRLGRLFPFLAP